MCTCWKWLTQRSFIMFFCKWLRQGPFYLSGSPWFSVKLILPGPENKYERKILISEHYVSQINRNSTYILMFYWKNSEDNRTDGSCPPEFKDQSLTPMKFNNGNLTTCDLHYEWSQEKSLFSPRRTGERAWRISHMVQSRLKKSRIKSKFTIQENVVWEVISKEYSIIWASKLVFSECKSKRIFKKKSQALNTEILCEPFMGKIYDYLHVI